jgi:hypothetical protein
MKHLKAVVAAVIGSVLFAFPSWLRPALSPDWQKRIDLMLTFDVNTIRKAYLILIPISLFWATYKAWQEENTARIGAEKATPEALKIKVEELAKQLEESKAQQRRVLSPQQRVRLKAAIEAIQAEHGAESLRFPIIYNHMVGEAADYAGQLNEVFFPCGVSYGIPVSTPDVPMDFQGLALWVKDEHAPPQRARLFMRALQESGLQVRFETLTGHRAPHIKDEHCEFVVGRRESIGEIERQLTKLQTDHDSRWQSLSEQQRTDFIAALKEFQSDRIFPTVMIFPDFTRHDAVELSHTIARLCREVNWYAGTYDNATPKGIECPPGLTIYANAERPDVKTFVRALQRAQIPYRQTAPVNHPDLFEIRIGRRRIV